MSTVEREQQHLLEIASLISDACALARSLKSEEQKLEAMKDTIRLAGLSALRVGEKSIYLSGLREDVAMVSLSGKLKSPSAEQRDVLETALGETLFEETINTKFNTKSDTLALLTILLDAGHDPSRWFTMESAFAPVNGLEVKVRAFIDHKRRIGELGELGVAESVSATLSAMQKEKPSVTLNPRLSGKR